MRKLRVTVRELGSRAIPTSYRFPWVRSPTELEGAFADCVFLSLWRSNDLTANGGCECSHHEFVMFPTSFPFSKQSVPIAAAV